MAFVFHITNYGQTIAVPGIYTNGIETTSHIATKLLRLELVKIDKYTVLDEFDLKSEVVNDPQFENCYGKSCLIEFGKNLEVDFMLSGSIDGFGNKIIITLKLIDVNSEKLKSTVLLEFDNQEAELQRMLGIAVQEMHGITPDAETKKRLAYKDEMIISTNVGRINNNGPRIGVAYVAFGDIYDFYTVRTEEEGGLNILPFTTNMGYQFEAQYIGTENFSALIEFIPNVAGMDQGQFIPTLSIMNGFRFGKNGWEFAFGPTFGFRKTSLGFIEDGAYITKDEYVAADYAIWKEDPLNWDPVWNTALQPYVEPVREYKTHLDKRGDIEFNASWIMGVGRTFRAGALNIPFNIYYSSNKFGGLLGMSIGFNVTTRKASINQ